MRKRDVLGRQFVLWRKEIQTQKYEDQFNISRERQLYVVHEAVEVVVTETKDVPDEFRGMKKIRRNMGWKAVAANGDTFVTSWSNSNGSYQPHWWHRLPYRKEEKGIWCDGVEAYNRQLPSVRHELPDGALALPPGVEVCAKHPQCWLPGDNHGCWTCFLESISQRKPAA